jgi:hypothetical protein
MTAYLLTERALETGGDYIGINSLAAEYGGSIDGLMTSMSHVPEE